MRLVPAAADAGSRHLNRPGYSSWVNDKNQRDRWGPYFDSLEVRLCGKIIVPTSPLYAEASISMSHHDAYSEAIETKDPHPVIGNVKYEKPILKGTFSVPQRMIAILLHAIDRGAARYLYVHSDPLKRNRAYVRSVDFESAKNVEDYFGPT